MCLRRLGETMKIPVGVLVACITLLFSGILITGCEEDKAAVIQLRSSIEFSHQQTGIVGRTAKTWSIRRNGDWTVSHFINGELIEQSDSKTLTPEARSCISRSFERHEWANITPIVGKERSINPGLMQIKYADKTVTLFLSPTDNSSEARRILAINTAITDILTNKHCPEDK